MMVGSIGHARRRRGDILNGDRCCMARSSPVHNDTYISTDKCLRENNAAGWLAGPPVMNPTDCMTDT